NGMDWWGSNKAFKFDRLVTVYGSATWSGYEGTLGIADAAEVKAFNMVGSGSDPVLVGVDSDRPAFLGGIPKRVLGASARVVAAVGSSFMHNDDVPDSGAIQLAP